MALIYWGEQNYKVALEIYQFLVGQYEKRFIKPDTNIGVLDPEVVLERRKGLEWLISDIDDWNEISLDT